MISAAQKALLHVAKQRLGIEEADYRALLSRAAGASSSMELDAAGFERVLAEFRRIGFIGENSRPIYGDRVGMATAKQIAMIRRLWKQYSGHSDDTSLCTWLERFGHVSHLRFLTRARAATTIEALKDMTSRRTKSTAVAITRD